MISVGVEAVQTTREIVGLIEEDRQRIVSLGRAAPTALALFDVLIHRIVVSVPIAVQELPFSEPTVYNAVRKLEGLGILKEMTGMQRNRVFAYDAYLSILTRESAVG